MPASKTGDGKTLGFDSSTFRWKLTSRWRDTRLLHEGTICVSGSTPPASASTMDLVPRTIAQARKLRPLRRKLPDDPIQHVDRFTAGHAMVGFLLGLWGKVPWWGALGASVAWELAEVPLKKYAPALFPQAIPDTIENSLLDVAAWMSGYGAAQLLPKEKII